MVAKTVHRTLPGSLSCLSKTGPCAVISSQISFTFAGKVVRYLLCMPLLVFLGTVLSAVEDFRSILGEQ